MNVAYMLNILRKNILDDVYPIYGNIIDVMNELIEESNYIIEEEFNDDTKNYDYWSDNIENLILALCDKYSQSIIYLQNKFCSEFNNFLSEMVRDISKEYKLNTKKLENNLKLIDTSVCKQMKDFCKMTINTMSDDIRNNVYIKFNDRFKINEYKIELEEINEEYIEEDIKDNDTLVLYKIFSYKDMCDLAIKNGYKYKWSNGSHRIYEHNTTNKIIVIPSHELGIGLSSKIQKQIFNNKLAI